MNDRDEPVDAPAEQRTEHDDADDTINDDTIVVPTNDHTVVVPRAGTPLESDDTVVVTSGAAARAAETSTRGHRTEPPEPGESGEPVIIAGAEVPPSLAKLLFKKPLDTKRRAPVSPFPASQSSLPRGGVRSGIPVVYGANSSATETTPGGTDFARWLGPPPMGYELLPARRNAVVTEAKLNRNFRIAAYAGGVGVIAVTAFGLWWVLGQLLGQ